MTRLKDALEKAAALHEDAQSPRVGQFSHPAQIVPDAWQFDESELAVAVPPAVEARVVAPPVAAPSKPIVEAAAPMPVIEATAAMIPERQPAEPSAMAARIEDRPQVAQPRPKDEFWHTYQFGQKGIGKVVVAKDADAGLVEQYRRLGAALHHHQLQSGARTMMVTSAVAAEGKTLTATNLALTLSHSYQRRVLLIDADLRRPSVHDILRLPNTIGLSDSLRHPELGGLRYHTVSPYLSAVTAGRADSDPMAGLVSDTMNRLLMQATQQFDWVIVDTPPVALLPDANLLAAMIDTALLVVSANATPYPLVRRAIEAIGEQRILGVVLNRMAKADIVAAYNYYGYGQYAYGAAKAKGRSFMFWRKRKPKDVKLKAEEAAAS